MRWGRCLSLQKAIGTGLRHEGWLGCEWKGADRAGIKAKDGGLATSETIGKCEWVGG